MTPNPNTAAPFKVAVNRQVINKSKDFESLATEFQNYLLTQEQLAAEINQGHAFTTHHEGRRNQDNFTGGGYIALDFDQADPKQMAEIMSDETVNNYYAIFYHTPSSTPEHPKFRIIFQLEQAMEVTGAYRKLVAAFIWRFSATADASCSDPCRLFYGSKGSNPKVTGRVIPNEEVGKILAAYDKDQQYEENLRTQARKASGSFTADNLTLESKKKIFNRILESHCIRIRGADKGNRHYTLVKSAKALGGYIAGEPEAADEHEVRSRLEEAYSSHQGANRNEMRKAIDAGLKYGLKSPLRIEVLIQGAPGPAGEQKRNDEKKSEAPPKGKPKLEPFEATFLMRKEFAPIKWVVPGLLPEGSTLAAARPKIGKSWMMLALSVAVAEGGIFLGMYKCEQGEVLYCALEDNERRLKDRLRLLLNGRPAPENLHFLLNLPRIGDGFVEALREYLEAHPNIRLVVIDTLSKIKPVKGKDESVYESDYKAGEGIKSLTDQFRFSCVMVFHTRKAEAEDPIEKVSGSFGLTGGVDNVWIIDRKTSESEGKLSITGRDIEEQELAVSFDKEIFQWVCRGDAAMYGENTAREEVLKHFRDTNNRPMKANELCLALGKTRQEYDGLRKLLHRMVQNGKLSEDARGFYKIAKYVSPDPNQENFGIY
jgi:hypothetical protein